VLKAHAGLVEALDLLLGLLELGVVLDVPRLGRLLHAVGGLDTTILPHVDWRVIEFAYSAATGSPVNAKIFTTGLVLRLW